MALVVSQLDTKKYHLTEWSWVDQLTSSTFNWTSSLIQNTLNAANTQIWVFAPQDNLPLQLGFILIQVVDSETLEILSLAIKPQYQKNGWMHQALAHLISIWAIRGFKQIWLEVHEKNTSAQTLYYLLGFQVNARRQRYYQDGSAGLLMSLTISP